jgi:CO/xanthine dehydrogenase FAD-binding subunit
VRLLTTELQQIQIGDDVIQLVAGVTMSRIAKTTAPCLSRSGRQIDQRPGRPGGGNGGRQSLRAEPLRRLQRRLALGAIVSREGPEGAVELDLEGFFKSRARLAFGTIVTTVRFPRPKSGDFRVPKVSHVKPKGAAVLSIAALVANDLEIKFLWDKISERPDAGAGSCYHHRQLRRIALERRSGTGHEVGHRADLRREARRAHRPCDHRHGGFRYRSAHCMGRFASRATHRIGNAVINDRRPTVLTAPMALARRVRMCPFRPSPMRSSTPSASASTVCRILRALQAKEGTQAAEA